MSPMGGLDPRRRQQVEYAVLVVAVLAFVVMFALQIGPPPLLLVPWLVVAVVGTSVLTRGRGG